MTTGQELSVTAGEVEPTDADRARARELWRAARWDADANGAEDVIAAALAEGRRQVADEVAALIGTRVHLGPGSLGRLLAVLDAHRDRAVVAREFARDGGGRRG